MTEKEEARSTQDRERGWGAHEGRNKVTKSTKPAGEKNCQTQNPQNNRYERKEQDDRKRAAWNLVRKRNKNFK